VNGDTGLGRTICDHRVRQYWIDLVNLIWMEGRLVSDWERKT